MASIGCSVEKIKTVLLLSFFFEYWKVCINHTRDMLHSILYSTTDENHVVTAIVEKLHEACDHGKAVRMQKRLERSDFCSIFVLQGEL